MNKLRKNRKIYHTNTSNELKQNFTVQINEINKIHTQPKCSENDLKCSHGSYRLYREEKVETCKSLFFKT